MEFLKWARYHWDRVAAGVLVGLGLLTLLLGYLGISGTVYPAEQLPYMLSGGILGLFFLGSAAILYLSADMRDEWRKLDSIDASLKELTGQTTRDADDDDATAAEAPDITSDLDKGGPSREVVATRSRRTASSSNSNSNGDGSQPRAAARQGSQRRSTGQRAGTKS